VFYDITSLALGVLRELPCVALRLSEARVRTFMFAFASWRRRGSHAKKSSPAQQHRSHALRKFRGAL